MIRKIHPAFKNFILTDAVREWDSILKRIEGKECGVESGTCFQTSNAFCRALNDDFDIPCEISMVETLIGNKKSEELFIKSLRAEKPQMLLDEAERVVREKGKENLTADDPVLVGMGIGGEKEMFHFIMNLPKHGEVIDLTLSRVDRPQWGIKCNNYWAKYDKTFAPESFIGADIAVRSKCVLYNTVKKTPGSIGVNPEKYTRAERELRIYLHEQVHKRKIPVFFR
jgi:hypothetical protein